MMSFHLPPIAARAAVSGHPLMALRRAGREWLPKGAILIIFIVAQSLANQFTDWICCSLNKSLSQIMEPFIFARFHARPGQEMGVESALHKVVAPTRQEGGCLSIHAFRSIRDQRLFYIHSRWVDEAAFDNHVSQPYTRQFVEDMQPLVDHELDTTRANLIE
jgi:quinol monooxygenase YgiN